MKHSSRAAIAPFLAMEVARACGEREAAGERLVRFDVGQPSGGAPQSARRAAAASVGEAVLGYTDALGLPALRQGLSDWYRRRHGLSIAPDRIIVTTGSSGAFLLAFLALFETGDQVGLASPGYPPYRHILSALGMSPRVLQAEAEDRYQLSAQALRRAAGLRGALIASPANPTGTMLDRPALGEIAAACAERGLRLVSDEIYHGLVYDGRTAETILSVTQDAIVINSFSKYFAMTGWRVGWIVAPEALVRPIERLAQNLFICPPHVAQVAALAALEAQDELDARRDVYARNRAALLARLPSLGFGPIAPADGAFYLYADVSAHTHDSVAWCARLLDETGVALTPGVDFDEARGARWVRLAYARGFEEVEDGLARLARALG
jgi:aspartate/methionine/tyrosine aminotransferase